MTPLAYVFWLAFIGGWCMWVHDVCTQYAAEIPVPVKVRQ